MGWLVVFAVKPLFSALPAAGIAWLIAGEWLTHWERSFTYGKNYLSITPSGTYLYWRAASAIFWPSLFTLFHQSLNLFICFGNYLQALQPTGMFPSMLRRPYFP
jgi:predicted membrane channel-forming protein YqfA (hemolysin III family)